MSQYDTIFTLPTLIARERKLSALTRALHSASRNAGARVLLTGEAGISKSRLVSELGARAAAERFTILEGHCIEQDRSFPYAPWIDSLRAFLAPKSATETSQMLGPPASRDEDRDSNKSHFDRGHLTDGNTWNIIVSIRYAAPSTTCARAG